MVLFLDPGEFQLLMPGHACRAWETCLEYQGHEKHVWNAVVWECGWVPKACWCKTYGGVWPENPSTWKCQQSCGEICMGDDTGIKNPPPFLAHFVFFSWTRIYFTLEYRRNFYSLPHFCSPSPTFCSPSPMFCSPSPTFCSTSPTFCSFSPNYLLILAPWSSHPVWRLSWRPGYILMHISSPSCSIMPAWIELNKARSTKAKLVQNHIIVAKCKSLMGKYWFHPNSYSAHAKLPANTISNILTTSVIVSCVILIGFNNMKFGFSAQ